MPTTLTGLADGRLTLCTWAVAWSLLSLGPAHAADVDFAHDVVPVLKEYCGKCHTGDQKKGGLSLNTRESLLSGGDSGDAVTVGNSRESELLTRIVSMDKSNRMPPDGPRVPPEKVALLKEWINTGLPWEAGFSFSKSAYEPPLKPRRPELPPAQGGRDHPVDRILDAQLMRAGKPLPGDVSDAAFARRASLDLVGLLPTPQELQDVEKDARLPDRRERLVKRLLARDVDYAEHWLTFWNDLLRNDYSGTGFITGGRKQISKWLYEALVTNKPYDQFARELIAPPTQESVGFIEGIRWRGDVSAGQTVEMQFAQSIAQSLLGINLKCASCHNSFIDRWTLEESYGLAAIYSTRPLEIHRCDKPVGKTARAAWLFPEIGQIDAEATQPERLKQLAALMTHPDNGRFSRAIVNRLWHRMMGRGIVHPPDAMQSEPWNADLLDFLAVDFAEHGYDLKHTLELIATSKAYQGKAELVTRGTDDKGYVYAGPRAKRLTAEQFVDATWQLTSTAPGRIDAPVLRGRPDPEAAKAQALTGRWIWSRADAARAAAGETITFRRKWDLKEVPSQAIAVATCDNSYVLTVNGQKVAAGENWSAPDAILLTPHLKAGSNEIVIVARNGGNDPNPAGLFFEARTFDGRRVAETLGSDGKWEWTAAAPNANGKFAREPADWKPAVPVDNPGIWSGSVSESLSSILARGGHGAGLMVRSSLLKSDFLMRSLGRPNRDQIVSVRPAELTTLEAMDLSNGSILAETLKRGAKNLLARNWESPTAFVNWLYQASLSRTPTETERDAMLQALGTSLTEEGIEDALWCVIMLPEFQLVR